MINITGTTLAVTQELLSTTIGTCDYSARIFDATGEVLHEVTAINGIKLQWITPAMTSIATLGDEAVAKIAELRPTPAKPKPMSELSDEEKATLGINW